MQCILAWITELSYYIWLAQIISQVASKRLSFSGYNDDNFLDSPLRDILLYDVGTVLCGENVSTVGEETVDSIDTWDKLKLGISKGSYLDILVNLICYSLLILVRKKIKVSYW